MAGGGGGGSSGVFQPVWQGAGASAWGTPWSSQVGRTSDQIFQPQSWWGSTAGIPSMAPSWGGATGFIPGLAGNPIQDFGQSAQGTSTQPWWGSTWPQPQGGIQLPSQSFFLDPTSAWMFPQVRSGLFSQGFPTDPVFGNLTNPSQNLWTNPSQTFWSFPGLNQIQPSVPSMANIPPGMFAMPSLGFNLTPPFNGEGGPGSGEGPGTSSVGATGLGEGIGAVGSAIGSAVSGAPIGAIGHGVSAIGQAMGLSPGVANTVGNVANVGLSLGMLGLGPIGLGLSLANMALGMLGNIGQTSPTSIGVAPESTPTPNEVGFAPEPGPEPGVAPAESAEPAETGVGIGETGLGETGMGEAAGPAGEAAAGSEAGPGGTGEGEGEGGTGEGGSGEGGEGGEGGGEGGGGGGNGDGGESHGGRIQGGTPGRDSVKKRLMPGEFVVHAKAAKRFAPLLEAINRIVPPPRAKRR